MGDALSVPSLFKFSFLWRQGETVVCAGTEKPTETDAKEREGCCISADQLYFTTTDQP